MSKLNFLPRNLGPFVSENASSILTGVGVVGTVATGALAFRGGVKAERILTDENIRISLADGVTIEEARDNTSKTDQFKLVWPQLIPPVIAGTATIAAIILGHRMSLQKATALAAAYGLSESRLKDYRGKLEEKVGIKKADAVDEAIAQEKVNNDPPPRQVLVMTGNDVLFLDLFTGRYFRSTVENVKRAENFINGELFAHRAVSLTEFYDQINLDGTSMTDYLGWNQIRGATVEVKFTPVTTPDQQPCIAIDFAQPPIADFTHDYA